MKEKEMEKLIKTIEAGTVPPDGLKQNILKNIMDKANGVALLSPFEKFIFEKPLRAALAAGFSVSGFLWAVFGKGFADFFGGIIG